MKWVGQNIWSSISRFRDEVYFEDSITLSTGKSITMDEYTSGTLSITKIQDSGTTFNDNDTSLMTAAAISDKIEAYGYSTTSGDITGVTFTTDDDATISDTAGSADFIITGGEGIDTSSTGSTVTITGEEATTSNKGVASFNSNQFSVSSGAASLASTISIGADDDTLVTIKRLAHSDDDGANLKIQAGDGGGTNKAGGNINLFAGGGTGNATGGGINFISTAAGSSGSSANSFANIAELSSVGNLQLDGTLLIDGSTLNFDDVALTAIQTSAESFVDNDTSIMTSAAIEDKINAGNIIILSAGNGYLNTITADEWYFGNNSYGHSYHLWNNVKAAITADAGTFTMSEDYNLVGRLVPIALAKVQLQVSSRPAGGGATDEVASACIVSADRDGAGTNTTWTVLAQGTITQVQGEYDGVDITYTGAIATSKMLAVGIGSTESGSIGTTNMRFNYTLTGHIA